MGRFLVRSRVTQVQTGDRNTNQLQTNINSALAPLLQNPLLTGQVLNSVTLVAGVNIINHGLGRPLLGWVLTRQRGLSDIYDAQDANTQPALTLALSANFAVVVDLYVF